MKKEKLRIAIRLIFLYLIMLGMTALPLLFNLIAQSSFGRLLGRMLTYFLMAAITFLFCKNKNNVFADLGYSTKNMGKQVLIGMIVLAVTISIFVILPLLLGVNKEMVLSVKQTDMIKILEQILFLMLFVGPIEEFIFRGYFQEQLEKIFSGKTGACIIASLLFGFWHFPSTLNIINVLCTFVIGFIYSIFKTKYKNCTMVSVSLAHGLHDTVIFLLSCILM